MLQDLKIALDARLHPLRADLALGAMLGCGSFAAIDFETATSSRDSACAIGVAVVESGAVSDVRSWLVRPPANEYDRFNTQIHSIQPADTAESPSLTELWPTIERMIDGRTVVAHNAPFDIGVLKASLDAGCERRPLRYACTLRLARLAWPGRRSYRLGDLGGALQIRFRAHDAGDDAAAAAQLAIACCGRTRAATLDDACSALGIEASST